MPRYVVTPLDGGQPARINDAGEIAGRVNFTAGTVTSQHAAVYRNGEWLDLGTLADDNVSIGTDINGLGVVVGMSNRNFTFSDSRYRAIEVVNGVLQAVPGLGGKDSIAYAVNDSGQVCGKMGPEQPESLKPWHAFLADASSVTDLHPAVEAALGATRFESTAVDVNGSGDVVGQISQSFTPPLGFLYRNGSVTLLAGGSGAAAWSLYFPSAINDSGLVAGIALSASTTLAATYDSSSSTFTLLPAPPGAGSVLRSAAYDVDAAGRVVGEALVSVPPNGGRGFAFLYQNGETIDLNTLIPEGSGWVLQSAIAMNDAGQIVGSGVFNGVFGHYFLLTPANDPPTLKLDAPPSAGEGSSLTLSAAATDPEGGALVYAWDTDGDGTYETGGGAELLLDPVGDDGPATRTVGVRVTDEAGLTATAAATIEILNTAPTATLTSSASDVYTNTPVTLTLGSPHDPSLADTTAGFWYAWDCTSDGVFEASGAAAAHACAFATGGRQTARARIEDKNGGFTDYEVAVNVRTPQQGIGGVIDIVRGFGLPKGRETSLVTKLQHALEALGSGDLAGACGSLQAFVNEAGAQSGKSLTPAQASQIIAEAEAIRAVLGCL